MPPQSWIWQNIKVEGLAAFYNDEEGDGYDHWNGIYGGNMTVSHSHPYSLCHIPTWWEYGGWEYASKPLKRMMMIIMTLVNF